MTRCCVKYMCKLWLYRKDAPFFTLLLDVLFRRQEVFGWIRRSRVHFTCIPRTSYFNYIIF